MALRTSIELALSAVRSVAMSGNAATEKHTRKRAINWPNGSGTSQAQEVWSDDRSLGVGTEVLDIRSLTQLDDAGATLRSSIRFGEVKGLLIRNTLAAGATGRLRVGGDAADAWEGAKTPFVVAGGKIDIDAGGLFLWVSPIGGPSAANAKDLLIEAIGATVTYEIVIVGDA